jgi:hypothetical protein
MKAKTIDPNKLDISPEETIQHHLTPLQEAIQKVGITDEMLAQRLAEELDATKDEWFAFQGIVTDCRTSIDWRVRQSARQDIHKLRGDYAPEKQIVDVTEHNIYTDEEREALMEVANIIAAKRMAPDDNGGTPGTPGATGVIDATGEEK